MRMGPCNDGPEPPAAILRAIRDAVAGAYAAAVTPPLHPSYRPSSGEETEAILHQAASRNKAAWASAKTSRVIPKPSSLE